MNADRLRPNDDQTMNTARSRSNNARAEDRPTVWTRSDDTQMAGRKRLTVAQAAELLGLSAEAVRSRVQRGTLQSEKVGGTVYVLLEDTVQSRPNTDEPHATDEAQTNLIGDQTEFIGSLQGQIEWLRREVERKDTLLMTLMQRVPELDPVRNPAPEPREAPETPAEGTGEGDDVPPDQQEDVQRRSWLYKFFFGP
jgi:excisionase family DNA binding protein